MAVSIEDLINKKAEIQQGKKQQYDIETSIGTVTVQIPKRSILLDSQGL